MTKLRIQLMPIDRVNPDPGNAKMHSGKQIKQIADSIKVFGFTNPLLVTEDGLLIAGEGRWEAAKALGLTEVPVIIIAGLSPAKRRGLAIADNKIAENARWNRERLAIEIAELTDLLPAEGLDISIVGFDPVEIERIELDSQDDSVGVREEIDAGWCERFAISKPGDLWLLGDHRLLCGDPCCCARDLARLMGECRADVAFLDPSSETPSCPDTIGSLRSVLDAALAVSRPGAFHLVSLGGRRIADVVCAAKQTYGDPLDIVVWVKSKTGPAAEQSPYRNQHELIGLFRVPQALHSGIERLRRGHSRSNLWRHREANVGRADLTAFQSRLPVKPVALIADAIEEYTRNGAVVLDAFTGWGTTLIAAEQAGRRACALDVEPCLVDFAIRRWQAFTHQDARHAESGLSFDEIAAEGSRASRSQK
jgi:hypothetical protein